MLRLRAARERCQVTVGRLLEVPVFRDERGLVGVVEGPDALPFPVRRLYFLADVPGGSVRGEHAHRELQQLIIAMSGSVMVHLDDGTDRQDFILDAPSRGLLVPPGCWRELRDFAPGTVVAVLASHEYDEADYIRDHGEFMRWIHER